MNPGEPATRGEELEISEFTTQNCSHERTVLVMGRLSTPPFLRDIFLSSPGNPSCSLFSVFSLFSRIKKAGNCYQAAEDMSYELSVRSIPT